MPQLTTAELRVLRPELQARIAEEAEQEAAQLAREESQRREVERQAKLNEQSAALKEMLLDKIDAAEAAAQTLDGAFDQVEAVAAELRTVEAERGKMTLAFSPRSVRRRLSQYFVLTTRSRVDARATMFTPPGKKFSWRDRERTTLQGTGWTAHD